MKRAARKAADIVARVEERIGHRFADAGRLERALTHSSLRNPSGGNYERLEFLGDRVLGLCVAELLFEHFREASEGELSVRLNQLVSAQTCGEVADELGLHEFIRTGADVKQVTDKRMLNVRADVVESIIAAIYLDAGPRGGAELHPRPLEGAGLRRGCRAGATPRPNCRNGPMPALALPRCTGSPTASGPDHEPVFKVIVEVPGAEPASGVSRSKRAAEQAAATTLLEREGVWQRKCRTTR
jgi:ribonuclease-3